MATIPEIEARIHALWTTGEARTREESAELGRLLTALEAEQPPGDFSTHVLEVLHIPARDAQRFMQQSPRGPGGGQPCSAWGVTAMTSMPSWTMEAAGVPIRPFGGTTHGLPALSIRRVREALDRRMGTSGTWHRRPRAMTASVQPQTPEEAAALRELAATHRRRHRWLALYCSVIVSVHATLILHTIWQD